MMQNRQHEAHLHDALCQRTLSICTSNVWFQVTAEGNKPGHTVWAGHDASNPVAVSQKLLWVPAERLRKTSMSTSADL